jgi:hypothetical protein
MHLKFTTYDGVNKFSLSESNETTKDMEFIFSEYSKTRKQKMNKYIKIFKLEQKLGKMRSKMLREMKKDFKTEFLPEFKDKNPEYFI